LWHLIVCLKAYPDTNLPNVKGNGQECPFYTGSRCGKQSKIFGGMTWTWVDGWGILEVLLESSSISGGAASVWWRKLGGVFMPVSCGGDGDAVPGFIPWMMAVAEEPGDGWLERRKRNPKRMGELSQAAFLLKAGMLGLGVAIPWGDSEKYDFIVGARRGGRLLRVQVKATGRLNRGGYDVQPVYATRDEGKKSYTAEEIDVLAARVVIEEDGREVWYVLPISAFEGRKSLRFYPDLKSRRPRWEGYREAWEWVGVATGSPGKRVLPLGAKSIPIWSREAE
jgi:hypothetical protein